MSGIRFFSEETSQIRFSLSIDSMRSSAIPALSASERNFVYSSSIRKPLAGFDRIEKRAESWSCRVSRVLPIPGGAPD